MTAPTAPVAPRPVAQQTRMPAGVRMSTVWRSSDGESLIEAHRRPDGTQPDLPVDADFKPVGALWMCENNTCPTQVWVFDPIPTAKPEQEFCSRDGKRIVPCEINPDDPDPIGAARTRKAHRLALMYAARRKKVADALSGKADEAKAAAVAASRRTVADLRKHTPSALVSASGLLAGWWLVSEGGQVVAAAAGVALSTFGAVTAYLAVYVAERMRVARGADEVVGRTAARLRARARHVASGVLALGCWLLTAALTGAELGSWGGTFCLLLGTALVWAVNRQHWDKLWDDRRRLAELARLKAEEAARRAAEAAAAVDEIPEAPEVAWDDLLAVGRYMAGRWQEIARSDTVPASFPMRRTWIVAEKTRELSAPGPDGQVRRIGHEFLIRCEPGALAARMGVESPLVSARKWLADMLERDPATVELVDRPDGQPNTGLLILTDSGTRLAGVVRWKGRAGVRRTADGAIYVHDGQSLQGEDVEATLYVPGQAGGGATIGTTGGGKSAGTILDLLNCLAAEVFPILHDPKELVDYGDFVGVFPIGVTQEHRDVILASLVAERSRRQKHVARNPVKDRHQRRRRGESLWNIADGPPMKHFWEEFHDTAQDDQFVDRLTNHIRFQRVAAMLAQIITQGGGLADFNNSMLRSLLNQQSLTIYRTDDHQARLGGMRELAYSPADLPRLPGTCLIVSPTAPPMPMRRAYVHRDDRDGSVFDQLYGPNMEPLLTVPALPAATVEVFEKMGLMDLWRLGQGEDGLDRLLSGTNTSDGPMPTAAVVGQRMFAEDIILGVTWKNPGCDRAFINAHAAWASAPGWSKKPAESTISRAVSKLIGAGLLSKVGLGEDFRVLPAGEPRAERAWLAICPTDSEDVQAEAAAVDAVEDGALW